MIRLLLFCGLASQGFAAIALVTHTTCVSGSPPAGIAACTLNSTGANLLVVGVSSYNADPAMATLMDTVGACGDGITTSCNTWSTCGASAQAGFPSSAVIWYARNATVGASHLLNLTANYPVVFFSSWSGADTASPCDQANRNISDPGATTWQAGSITPTVNGSLIFDMTGYYNPGGSSPPINSGMTVLDFVAAVGGTNIGGAVATLVQGSAAAINPTWGPETAIPHSAVIASFKPSSTGTMVPRSGGGIFF